MRSRGRPVLGSLFLALLFQLPAPCGSPAFYVAGDPGPWPRILSAAGFVQGTAGLAAVCVVRAGDSGPPAQWLGRVQRGAYLVLEGDSALGQSFGFRPKAERVRVVSVEDLRLPSLSIVWERAAELPVFSIPPAARVFTRERHGGAPLVAGLRRGAGAVLWMATDPGERGYERFPYILQALSDLGLPPPFHSRRFWAFFDPAYRLRVDLDYFAGRWREVGIAGLHVASWRFFDPDPAGDEYLRKLIDACHRRGILVYAWLELPHVSERFWEEHPAWREKTALLQDAHLDWRKLMNLRNRESFSAAADGVRRLLDRFDWDGVNLAEFYFESLQGHVNPSRFTPMNDDVRAEFGRREGFDPRALFDASSQQYPKNEAGLRAFLDFRVELLARAQMEWIGELEAMRRSKPDLDLVLTHVDDRFDQRMRDAIGADTGRVLGLLGRRDVTFLVEDPATTWNLGPERYEQVSRKYAAVTERPDRLGIDINIVERYQDVYPTKQQTGVELLQLLTHAARAFPRVALYFEASVPAPDVSWLSSAGAVVKSWENEGGKLAVDSPYGVGIPWNGPALVDGRAWPFADDERVWLPAGAHTVAPAASRPPTRLLDFTGALTSAACLAHGLEFAYGSPSRALAVLDKRPCRVELDGAGIEPRLLDSGGVFVLFLPRGQHLVMVEMAESE